MPESRKVLPATALVLALMLSVAAGTQLVNFGRANPSPPQIVSDEGSPDSTTKPPALSIISPTNGTACPLSSVSLTYNASIGDSFTASVRFIWEVTIEADWLPNNVTAYEFDADKNPYTTEPTITQFYEILNLTGIPEGKHSVVVHARERGAYESYGYTSGFITTIYVTNFFIYGSSSVVFTVDLKPPTVSVLSVENKTYYTSDVPLTVAASEIPSHIAYSIDGQENVTTAGNSTLTNLPFGEHNVTVYATDLAGHVGASETVYFSVEVPETEPFSASLVVAPIASVTIVGVGLLVYFKRCKREAART